MPNTRKELGIWGWGGLGGVLDYHVFGSEIKKKMWETETSGFGKGDKPCDSLCSLADLQTIS